MSAKATSPLPTPGSGGEQAVGQRGGTSLQSATEFFSLESVDFGRLKEEVSANPIEEDHLIAEAVQMAQSRNYDAARDIAETVLLSNPCNSAALHVNASECESRQDWSEAARFFLVGMGHNAADPSMEHGFKTNVDMLRANRPRWLERGEKSKWDDVITFKPKPARQRTASPEEKPPWWRLGKRYEELLEDPGHVSDLIEVQADPAEERMEIRRIIYENQNYLNILFAYYKNDMNENWDPEQPIPDMVEHDGDEEDTGEAMLMEGFWRILKECKICYGDVKNKMPVAVFDRVVALGKNRIGEHQRLEAHYDVTNHDPHARKNRLSYYTLVETLMRIAYIRIREHSLSQRLELLLREMIQPQAMLKQTERFFLDFRSPAVQEVVWEPVTEARMGKIFDFFITNYKSSKPRSNTIGHHDMTMSLNHVIGLMQKMELFDPSFNVKKCVECFCKITGDAELLPQEHANNNASEMVLHEFNQLLMRTARIKSSNPKESTGEVFKKFLLVDFIPRAQRIIPGKI